MFKTMQKKLARFAICGAVALSTVGVAHASPSLSWTGSVGGSTYNFSVVSGGLSDATVQSTLAQQAWWDNAPLAQLFAQAVADHMGVNYSQGDAGSGGPIFASGLVDWGDGTYNVNGSFYFGGYSDLANNIEIPAGVMDALNLGTISAGSVLNFAVATEVPEISKKNIPVAAFVLLAFVLWYRAKRREELHDAIVNPVVMA